jgi:phage tail sheath protein FI
MAVYLSPGVFPREVDLSVLPSSIGPLQPAFIGVASKGPINIPTLITNATQYIETFGNPFPESYLGYAVLAFLEEGNSCIVMRVGVECEEGQPAELANICIDTSGARGSGWGRIPLFSGIDFGRITLRLPSSTNPFVFHDAAVTDIQYNDAEPDGSFGPTTATVNVTGTYSGAIDDSYILVIISPPNLSDGAALAGAGYQIIRNSDGTIVVEGDLSEGVGAPDGISAPISIPDTGLSVVVEVTAGALDVNDTFTWSVVPDNRDFTILVDGADPSTATTYTMPVATYSSVSAFVNAANSLLSGEDYLFVEHTLEDGVTVVPQIRTTVSGERIQVWSDEAWALEVGTSQYAWDIPRSYLLGLDAGPHNITSQNNRVRINVIGESSTKVAEFTLPVGLAQTTEDIAQVINSASSSEWSAFALTVPGGSTHLVLETSADSQFATLEMLANFSNLKTLRFAEEFNFPFPYKRSYRGFFDNRALLPTSGTTTVSSPASCEDDPFSDECASDTAYFDKIVGWLVAASPGTWINDYRVSLSLFTQGVGDASGRYQITISNRQGQVLESISDVSFDKRSARYVANLINPGSSLGGSAGNAFLNWEERPAFLENDVNNVVSTFEVRSPSQFANRNFVGAANGIPLDPAYSSELDAAVIGNPATVTGLYAFQNPESYDSNLILTPGFSTGAVIGTALQVCEGRGDAIYLVDPPFGLRPSQIIDWHNGMLSSGLNNAINSSYGALYWSWVRIFDQFNNTEIWVPPSGHAAAIYSRTARETEQWFAPAGINRGRVLTALDVEYAPSQGERDLLYGSGNAVNPLVKFPRDGIVIWGQRTLQRSASALDRVNVRMLLGFVKKNLTQLLRSFIFEPNDRVLWRQVQTAIEPFLADIQSRRGITGFRVVVDESNNTPERIDRNELWVTVFIRPTRSVEFIALNLVVLRTGASFSAEEVLAAGGIIGPQTVL